MEYSLGNETIIQPKRSPVRELAGRLAVLNIFIGAVIGAAIIWFLVAPAVNQSRSEKLNDQMRAYSEHRSVLSRRHWSSIVPQVKRHRLQWTRRMPQLQVMKSF